MTDDAPDVPQRLVVRRPVDTLAEFRPRAESPDDETVIREIWEENVYRMRPGHVRPGDRVIDLGANIGAFTVLAARMGAGEVVAVEPDPRNIVMLAEHARVNGVADVVRIIAGAVGAPGERFGTLAVADVPGGQGRVTACPDGDVPMLSLDDLLGPETAVVKVDIEGGEWPVFGGVSDVGLLTIRYLTMEWHAPVPGWALGVLAQRLAESHQVEMIGRPSAGGMLYATRYGDAPP